MWEDAKKAEDQQRVHFYDGPRRLPEQGRKILEKEAGEQWYMRERTLGRTVLSTQTGKPSDKAERVSININGEALGGREEEQRGFNGKDDGPDLS